jgi:hypothetical protein
MSRIIITLFILIQLCSIVYSQTTTTIYSNGVDNVVRFINENSQYEYSHGGYYQIGRKDGSNPVYSSSQEDINRSQHSFDLSGIPVNATLSQAKLIYYVSGNQCFSCTFNVTNTSGTQSYDYLWSEIASASTIESSLNYSNSSLVSSTLLTAVNSARSSGAIFLGVYSNDESGNLSHANVELRLEITYTVPPAIVNITVQNNFPGGTVKVGINSSALAKTSPYSFTATVGDVVNLSAIEQSNAGYERIWNDTEAPIGFSNWTKDELDISSSAQHSFTVTADDNDATITANLRKVCNVTFSNQFSGTSAGGSLEINGVTQTAPYTASVVEQNNITAEADNHDINGIRYIFRRWSVTETNEVLNLTVTSHTSKTAEFIGQPIFNESIYDNNLRGLTLSSGAGNKVKLTWNEHPHTNVTKYYIYRKIKNPDGSFTTPVHLATKNRGTLTFTDIEYTYQAGSGDYGLYYDVQAYYSTEGTYSPANYVYVRGDQSGDLTKDNSENNTQDLIVTNYDIGNFPNPFNPTTRINYQLPEQGHVTIKVYDMLGKEVAELVNETKESGIYNVNFDAGNLSSGVYVYMINVDALNAESKGYVMSKKMLMLK